jgi:hypothetical protein
MSENNRLIFFNIFIDCMLNLNALQNKLSLEEKTKTESHLIKNFALNWLMELLDMIKTLIRDGFTDQKKIEFSIQIFAAFIYSWSSKLDISYSNYKLISYDIDFITKNLHRFITKFFNQSYCKPLKNKVIDWLISVQLAYNFSTNFDKTLRGSLFFYFNI